MIFFKEAGLFKMKTVYIFFQLRLSTPIAVSFCYLSKVSFPVQCPYILVYVCMYIKRNTCPLGGGCLF